MGKKRLSRKPRVTESINREFWPFQVYCKIVPRIQRGQVRGPTVGLNPLFSTAAPLDFEDLWIEQLLNNYFHCE